jgi:hypothetical protein
MTHDVLLSLVHKTLYAPTTVAGLPYALTQAEQGNYQPLVTLSGATNLPRRELITVCIFRSGVPRSLHVPWRLLKMNLKS